MFLSLIILIFVGLYNLIVGVGSDFVIVVNDGILYKWFEVKLFFCQLQNMNDNVN